MANSALGKPSKKQKITSLDKVFVSIAEADSIGGSWGDTPAPKRKKEAVGKTGVPRVRSSTNKPVFNSIENLLEQENLEQVDSHTINVGAEVFHLVRNQNNAHREVQGFRAILAPCTVLFISERPKVRFSNGQLKNVKLESLFKRKAVA